MRKIRNLGLIMLGMLCCTLFGDSRADAGSYLIAILTDDLTNIVWGTPLVVSDGGDGSNADEADEVAENQDNADVENDKFGGNENNKGHGNNEDGMDSGNPGNKRGIDSSCTSEDNCVDDESGGGKGK